MLVCSEGIFIVQKSAIKPLKWVTETAL